MWFDEVQDFRDFYWSFRPILGWLQMIGVDLDGAGSSSVRRKIYQLFLFTCHVCLNVTFFIHLGTSEEKESVWIKGRPNKITFSLIFIADMVNMSLNGVAIHFLLLFHVSKRWKYLKFTLEAMKTHFNPDMMIRLRRISLLGVAMVILTVE